MIAAASSPDQNRQLSAPTALITAITAGAASPPIYALGIRILPVVLFAALLLLILAAAKLSLEKRALNRSLVSMLAGLIVAAVFSLFGSFQAGLSLQLPKFFILLFQYSMALAAFLVASEVRLTFLAWGCGIMGAVYGGLLILQSAGLIPGADTVAILESGFLRAQLFFGQPNGAAAYLVTILPLTFLVRPLSRLQWGILWILRSVIVIGLIATFSRSAMTASLVTLAIALILSSKRYSRLARISILTGLAALIFCSLNIEIYSLVELISASGGALESDYSAVERFGLGLAGIQMFYDQPLLGVGVGNYPTALGQFNSELDATLNIPHNTVIQFACEQGLLGVIAFSGILLYLVRNSRAIENPTVFPLSWAAWTVVINSWFGWPFIHGLGESFMIVLGLLAYHARRTTF